MDESEMGLQLDWVGKPSAICLETLWMGSAKFISFSAKFLESVDYFIIFFSF